MSSPSARLRAGRGTRRVSRRRSAPAVSRRIPRRRTRPAIPRWGFGLGIVALLAICAIAFTTIFLELYRLQREADRLLRMRHSLQQETAMLREEIRLLHTPEYIEKIAREQLGLVKPGEISLLLVQPPPKVPTPPAQPPAQPSWLSRMVRALIHLFSGAGRQ